MPNNKEKINFPGISSGSAFSLQRIYWTKYGKSKENHIIMEKSLDYKGIMFP